MESHFPCKQCGAVLTYEVGTENLTCDYCGVENPIPLSHQPVTERDYHQALSEFSQRGPKEEQITCNCQNCAAEFTLDANEHAGECPFCGTPVVTETSSSYRIKPWGLLPFSVERREAHQRYERWLRGLWFAPNKLKKYARTEGKLAGIYLPYWTYDSQTQTTYQGMRGTIYYEPVQYTTVVNGKTVVQTRMVARTRWRNVSGEVRRFFDDIPIPASHSLPQKVRYRLTDWDFNQLKPYQSEYLSGFRSEMYQTSLDQGFQEARTFMDSIIQSDIRQDIGGDRQRILNYNTQHRNITFKHVLVPTWLAAFNFSGKTYRFVVNGQTGTVHGERPYSVWKISFAVLAVSSLALLLFLASQGHIDWKTVLEELLRNLYY